MALVPGSARVLLLGMQKMANGGQTRFKRHPKLTMKELQRGQTHRKHHLQRFYTTYKLCFLYLPWCFSLSKVPLFFKENSK